ncbi:uncharacterized protein LOC105068497 [Camelus bactrianus]|uniref:Uncharacterized protein LOC105068497 n=1 Tax=Camelus bactrianus TaxID=9837 RepID=A0AC58P0W1_CAMBA
MSKFVHPGWTRPPGPVGCWLCSFPNADDAASQEKTPKHPRLEPRGASTTAPTSPAGTPPPRQPASLRGPPGRAERDSPRSPSSRAGDSGRGRRVAAPGYDAPRAAPREMLQPWQHHPPSPGANRECRGGGGRSSQCVRTWGAGGGSREKEDTRHPLSAPLPFPQPSCSSKDLAEREILRERERERERGAGAAGYAEFRRATFPPHTLSAPCLGCVCRTLLHPAGVSTSGSAALTDPGGVQGPLPRRRAGVSGWSQRSPRSPGQSYMTGRAFIHPHHRHRGNSRSFSVDYLLIFKAPLRVSVATCERCLLCWAVGDRGRFRQQVTLSRQRPLCSDAPRLPHGAGAEHLGASLRGPRKTLTATRHQGNGRGEHRPNTLGWL